MTLEAISKIVLVAVAIAAGLGYFSFWWTTIPAFFGGSFALANSNQYHRIVAANEQGNMTYFPTMLGIQFAGLMVAAAICYWVAGLFT